MKKVYSFMLMATALLFSANVKALDVTTFEELDQACRTAPDNAVLEFVLQSDITANKFIPGLWGEQVTIDLNGHNIESTADYILYVMNGSLTLVNSSETPATISGTGYAALVVGSPTDVADYSTLIIGENVNLTTTNDYGLVLAQGTSKTPHHGYGIVVEVNGHVQSASAGLWVLGNIQDKEGNIPQVTVGATGALIGGNGTGLYGGGYANYTIEGAVSGAIGIYAKAGNYDIKGDATITSTYTGSHQTVVPNGDGFTGGEGSAIVADSKAGYAGNMEFEISGNPTITTMAADGYAIEELNSDLAESQTKSIAISGGTFNGAISTTIEVKEAIVLNGTITGGTFSTDVTEYLNNITGVITPTIVDGKTIYVVAEKPAAAPDWINNINAATAASYVRLDGDGTQTLADDVEAAYLVMQGDNDKVIIPEGKTLTVGEIVMGPNAVVEVKAGARLVVKGANGIVANNVDNIVLESNGTNPSRFLLDPTVASNRNPKAVVEFTTKSWRLDDGSNYQWERFGIPTYMALESFTCDVDGLNTDIQVFDGNSWKDLGFLKKGNPFDASKLNKPFATYNLLAYRPTAGATYKMAGRLMGNTNAAMNANNVWNPMANSYTADVDITTFLTNLDANAQQLDAAIYIATPAGLGTYSWDPIDLDWSAGEKLAPMQAFIIRNGGTEAEETGIDYTTMVWNPAMGITSAPARRIAGADNSAKMKIMVANEQGLSDNVKMTENANRNSSFEKYMNDDVNIYVNGDMKQSIVAAEDLDNTYLGFSTVNGGNFTVSFSNVEGREFTLVDLATGTEVAVEEGRTYTFSATANTEADYRFKLVGRNNAPTALENTEAVKGAKGIYTLTGMYLGEMNIWNTLPAGVYVVDGAKRVK